MKNTLFTRHPFQNILEILQIVLMLSYTYTWILAFLRILVSQNVFFSWISVQYFANIEPNQLYLTHNEMRDTKWTKTIPNLAIRKLTLGKFLSYNVLLISKPILVLICFDPFKPKIQWSWGTQKGQIYFFDWETNLILGHSHWTYSSTYDITTYSCRHLGNILFLRTPPDITMSNFFLSMTFSKLTTLHSVSGNLGYTPAVFMFGSHCSLES